MARTTAMRSTGTMLLALIALGGVAFALVADHMTYDFNSSRKTPQQGLHDEDDTGIVEHHMAFGAFTVEGDVEPSDPEAARLYTDLIGYTLSGAGALLLLAALSEVPGLGFAPRWLRLTLLGVAAAAAAAAPLVGWFLLPGSMAGQGVDRPFTTDLLADGSGYVRTTLTAGWVAASCAVGVALGAVLMRYQAGSDDAHTFLREATA